MFTKDQVLSVTTQGAVSGVLLFSRQRSGTKGTGQTWNLEHEFEKKHGLNDKVSHDT